MLADLQYAENRIHRTNYPRPDAIRSKDLKNWFDNLNFGGPAAQPVEYHREFFDTQHPISNALYVSILLIMAV